MSQIGCRRGSPHYDPYSIADDTKTTCFNRNCPGNFECEATNLKNICCPKRDFVCGPRGGLFSVTANTSPNLGVQSPLFSTMVRYYYDTATRTCRSFNWYQQGGDFNNFATYQECSSYCSASTGTVV